MVKKKFICPQCKVSFTTRKDAKKHMVQKGHKGGVVVSFIDEKPKKEATDNRMYWHCPICDKKFKDESAVRNHMKAKNHIGKPVVKASSVPKKKVVEVVEEPKKETPPVRTFCRITEEDWHKIEADLPTNIFHHINPLTGNHIMDYTNKNEDELDYLFFKYDFVEIEMENADVVYCLNALDPTMLMMGYDLAEHIVVGIIGVNDDGHIIIHHDNYDENTLLTNEQLITSLQQTPQNNLACMEGVWEAPPKPVVKTTTYYGGGGRYSGYGGYGLTGYASEEEWGSRVLRGKKFNKSEKPAQLPAPVRPPIKEQVKTEEPVEVITAHPIYKIDEHLIYCDRVVDYEYYKN